jgi:hypothetical protein
VVERLRRAHSDGRIDLLEFDERLAAAYAAKTYGELEPLTADLPAESRRSDAVGDRGNGGHSRFSRAHRIALRVETAAWIFASVVNLGIWAIIALATPEAVYPWWIWVAGPWGLVLVARMLGERLRVRISTRF